MKALATGSRVKITNDEQYPGLIEQLGTVISFDEHTELVEVKIDTTQDVLAFYPEELAEIREESIEIDKA